MRSFKNIFLTNLLVVISLIPMVILLGALTKIYDNSFVWVMVGLGGIVGLSYLSYKEEKNGS